MPPGCEIWPLELAGVAGSEAAAGVGRLGRSSGGEPDRRVGRTGGVVESGVGSDAGGDGGTDGGRPEPERRVSSDIGTA